MTVMVFVAVRGTLWHPQKHWDTVVMAVQDVLKGVL